jgi:four helix bundle protein
MASQIFRSGTAIVANIREALQESKADFIHKFKISAKEGMNFIG